ncbi:MAG: LacI family DNA-binding transcriptional regulator [Pseudomonadota bacterium]
MNKIMNSKARRTSSTEIAKLAGVSQATVSRVLSGAPYVSEATRTKVMQVVEANSYRPNSVAQAMRTRRSDTIGVAVSRVTNPVVPEILEALGPKLTALGRRMIVWNTETEGADGVINAILQGTVDGVVFTAADDQASAIATAIERDLAVVALNRPVPGRSCAQVVSTNYDGSAELARYLLAGRRQRIAYINGPRERTTMAERERGFREALKARGVLIPSETPSEPDFSHARFRQIAIDLMKRPAPPDAIACGNDLIAFAVINGLKSIGIQVPEDVWVVGFDGVEMSGWDVFDLTTMRQPLDRMVAEAVSLLIEGIEDRDREPREIQCPTDLIVRGSTAHMPPPGI